MIEFLLRISGVKIDNAARIGGVSLALRNSGALGWAIALAFVLGGLTWWSYRRDARALVSPAMRRVLTGLRVALFFLLLLILLRPVLAFSVESSIRRTLLTLLDTSASMKIADPRFEPADLKRAAIATGALDMRKGLEQSLDAKKAAELKLLPRVDLLKGVLKNTDLKLLERFSEAYDVSAFAFGATLAELSTDAASQPVPEKSVAVSKPRIDANSWVEKLDPKSQTTAIGDAVRELITRKRGQPLAGIFLATDGANNAGTQPLEAARFARAEGVPIYIYGVGITSPRDIIVANMFAQEVAFLNDELPVTVRVRGQGMKGESAKITLRFGSEIVASKDLTFAGDDEQTVALPFTPKAMGEAELRASIEPRADEAVKENNSAGQRLKIIDSKIKVLMVEESPRWEFRYVQSVLLRDRRIDLKCWLLEGDPAIAGAEGSPYLKAFPQTKEELFKYDLVVLGDVSARDLGAAPIEWLNEFVSKFGGSVLFVAGNRNNPASYRGSALEKMLPIELGEVTAKAGPDRPATLELTPQGRTNPMLKLSPKDDENVAIWRKFPKVFWVARVARAKPAAQVLLQDSDAAKASRFGKMPVIAQQQFGLGQVLYVGTDNTWRWRKNGDDRYYPILWGQVTQKLGLAHLLGGSKRTQLTVDKQSYTTGDRVTIYARLYGADFNPVRDATVEAGFSVKPIGSESSVQAASRADVTLRAVPEQPGMYRGDFTAVTPGVHQFSVKSDASSVIEFTVAEPRFEFGETAMNEAVLKQMAEISGGAFFREETLFKLPETINAKADRVQSTVDAELWSSPIYFALLLAVATAEWALRKRAQLK